jgi:Zinc-finger associated domain (zf-AD)
LHLLALELIRIDAVVTLERAEKFAGLTNKRKMSNYVVCRLCGACKTQGEIQCTLDFVEEETATGNVTLRDKISKALNNVTMSEDPSLSQSVCISCRMQFEGYQAFIGNIEKVENNLANLRVSFN